MEEPRMQNCQPGILFLKGNRCLKGLSLTLDIWGKTITLLCLGRRGALVGDLFSVTGIWAFQGSSFALCPDTWIMAHGRHMITFGWWLNIWITLLYLPKTYRLSNLVKSSLDSSHWQVLDTWLRLDHQQEQKRRLSLQVKRGRKKDSVKGRECLVHDSVSRLVVSGSL